MPENPNSPGLAFFQSILVFLFFALAAPIPGQDQGCDLLDSSGHLDAGKTRSQYFEANFDTLTDCLESYRKTATQISVEDKILMFQFLGVMYSKDPETRKKGESYLYQWISLNPHAEIEGLFVSDQVQALFIRQKQDYIKVHSGPDGIGAARIGQTEGAAKNRIPESQGPTKNIFARHWVAWTAGAAITGALVTVAVWNAMDDSPGSTSESGKDQLFIVVPGGK